MAYPRRRTTPATALVSAGAACPRTGAWMAGRPPRNRARRGHRLMARSWVDVVLQGCQGCCCRHPMDTKAAAMVAGAEPRARPRAVGRADRAGPPAATPGRLGSQVHHRHSLRRCCYCHCRYGRRRWPRSPCFLPPLLQPASAARSGRSRKQEGVTGGRIASKEVNRRDPWPVKWHVVIKIRRMIFSSVHREDQEAARACVFFDEMEISRSSFFDC